MKQQKMEQSKSTTHVTLEIENNFEDFTYNLETYLGLLKPEIFGEIQEDIPSVASYLQNLGGAEELVLFNIIDHGGLLRLKGTPRKAKQYQIGNPHIASRMKQIDIKASLYVPMRILVYENEHRKVIVEYDLLPSLVASLHNDLINDTATLLNQKLLELIRKAEAVNTAL